MSECSLKENPTSIHIIFPPCAQWKAKCIPPLFFSDGAAHHVQLLLFNNKCTDVQQQRFTWKCCFPFFFQLSLSKLVVRFPFRLHRSSCHDNAAKIVSPPGFLSSSYRDLYHIRRPLLQASSYSLLLFIIGNPFFGNAKFLRNKGGVLSVFFVFFPKFNHSIKFNTHFL